MRSFCRYSTEGQQPRSVPPGKTNCPSLMAAHPEIHTHGGGTAVSRSRENLQILPIREILPSSIRDSPQQHGHQTPNDRQPSWSETAKPTESWGLHTTDQGFSVGLTGNPV